MIDKFDGQYRWLSNFWPVAVCMDGLVYPSVEHAYQAAKTTDSTERNTIRMQDTASKAKRVGKYVTLRPDWEQIKLTTMRRLLEQKFNYPYLKTRLLGTGDQELVEGNNWDDTYWGRCDGIGNNHLGLMLMEIRATLQAENENGNG